MDTKFQIGAAVHWASQSSGTTKEKTGRILAVVPAGKRPDRVQFLSLYKGAGVGLSRDHVSYVVGVEVGKTLGSSVRYYWPRVASLELVKVESAIGLEVHHEGSAAISSVLERCCMCRAPTPYWHGSDVALCPECAKTTELAMLPTKKEWLAKERALTPRTFGQIGHGDY